MIGGMKIIKPTFANIVWMEAEMATEWSMDLVDGAGELSRAEEADGVKGEITWMHVGD